MVGGRDLHTHRSDRETLADVVAVRRQALLFINEATHCVEWYSPVTRARSSQVGTL
jgi:hypothetical protein